jgi:hypothetical protein
MTPADPAARPRPIPMLLGLFVGTQTLVLCFLYYWPIAWMFPCILGAATYPWVRTRQFGIGAFAAASGAAVLALTGFVLLAPDVIPPLTTCRLR